MIKGRSSSRNKLFYINDKYNARFLKYGVDGKKSNKKYFAGVVLAASSILTTITVVNRRNRRKRDEEVMEWLLSL